MSMHYGQDEQTQKVQALIEKKAQLEAALPVVDDNRAAQIEARLDQIEAQLAREVARAKAIGNQSAIQAAMGLDGMGGLSFEAQAPPGQGRLLRLPFYPSNTVPAAVANVCGAGITSAGSGNVSTEAPSITILGAASAATTDVTTGGSSNFTLQTPQISWATLRIVGFEVAQDGYNNADTTTAGLTVVGSLPAPKVICKDLKIGGGANLLTHEDYGDADIYNADSPEFCGLRDYPILKSPNTATVDVAVVGWLSGRAASTSGVTFSCTLLCEVLQDDQYGTHVPGPYARGAAMVRRGGSFIS